jgi:phospholipase C
MKHAMATALFALVTLSAGQASPRQTGAAHKGPAADPLRHIVIVMQENRSMDDLFNGFCMHGGGCADTVRVDPVTGTPLTPVPLNDAFAPSDSRKQFLNEYGSGKGGFEYPLGKCTGSRCTKSVFDYVPSAETQAYWKLAADDGALSDQTLAPQQGPGLPAHLYAIAGQSGGYDPDRLALSGGSGTCGTSNVVPQIDVVTGKAGPKTVACKDFQTIFDLLVAAGHTWRYYTPDVTDFRDAPGMIEHLYGSPNVITPSTQFLTDIGGGKLADVTFVMPMPHDSDHPGLVRRDSAGPAWVASVVNAIGESPFWADTAVVVTWDDWGGFYDHVAPRMHNVFEYGFRVPLIVSSPYAKRGWIDHTPRTFVSALRLIEETFALPSLGTDDALEPDGLDSMLDFDQKPRRFVPLRP